MENFARRKIHYRMRIIPSISESFLEEASRGEDIGILASRMERRRRKWSKLEEDGTGICSGWSDLY